jgi:hypothetical protein
MDQVHVHVGGEAIEKGAAYIVGTKNRKQPQRLGFADFINGSGLFQEDGGVFLLTLRLDEKRGTVEEQRRIGKARGRRTKEALAGPRESQHGRWTVVRFIGGGGAAGGVIAGAILHLDHEGAVGRCQMGGGGSARYASAHNEKVILLHGPSLASGPFIVTPQADCSHGSRSVEFNH